MQEIKHHHFNEVLNKYENMIHYLIHKLRIRDPEKEFYQEGTIALWKAVESYDAKRGKFSNHAYFRIEKVLLDLIRKRNRQTEKEQAYINMVTPEIHPLTTTQEESIDSYLLNQISQTLTANQMKWFTLFVLQDLSLKAIAEREQVTVDAVKSWSRQAKPKIQKILREYYTMEVN